MAWAMDGRGRDKQAKQRQRSQAKLNNAEEKQAILNNAEHHKQRHAFLTSFRVGGIILFRYDRTVVEPNWFKKKNFMFNTDPLVMKADRFLISATMIIKPQTDVMVTIEELDDQ